MKRLHIVYLMAGWLVPIYEALNFVNVFFWFKCLILYLPSSQHMEIHKKQPLNNVCMCVFLKGLGKQGQGVWD